MNNKNRWNKDRFLRELELLQDKDDYIFSNYENINRWDSKFTVQCKKCNYIWQTHSNSFFDSGSRCFTCAHGEHWNIERFLREVVRLDDKDDYIFSDYENISSSKSKFTVQCKKCNNVWITDSGHFFNDGKRCYNCKIGEQWSSTRLEREFNSTNDCDRFTLLLDKDVLYNNHSKFRVKCEKGHTWKANISDYFHKGSRCPKCNESKGENKISAFLEKTEIFFEREKRFTGCKNIKPLPFDFYLPDYNLLIEFNGEHHYQVVTRSRNAEKNLKVFESVKKRKAIKKQWTTDNNYRFLIIKYDEMDKIEEILSKELGI